MQQEVAKAMADEEVRLKKQSEQKADKVGQ